MFEQKMIINRFINNLNPQVAPPPVYNDGDFVLVAGQPCYLQKSTGIGMKTSNVIPGAGPTAHRNFIWLPWLPGAISEVPLQHTDVLTGPMSGCWLVTYSKNGIRYAGHLGTDIASPNRSAAVNTAWNNFAIASRDNVRGFNPFNQWRGNFPAQQGNDTVPRIFGLYTVTNHFYAIFTYQQGATTSLRIAGVQQIPTANSHKLQRLP